VSEIERDILRALKDLETAVKSLSAATTKPDLQSIFSRIDTLRSQLPKDANPDLLHYLHKQSYEKARRWLEGQDAENAVGSCRH
jgi:hypothetical protein